MAFSSFGNPGASPMSMGGMSMGGAPAGGNVQQGPDLDDLQTDVFHLHLNPTHNTD
jgi:hypothetical protein